MACGISGAASPVRVCHERLVNPPHDCQAFACPAWPRRHYNGRAMAEELNLDGSALSIAVIVARFNEAITSRLLDGALGAVKGHGVGEHAVYWVPGSFELPVAAKRLAEAGVPCIFGVLTCDTEAQAIARSGGDRGNKGFEAVESAIGTANLIRSLRTR